LDVGERLQSIRKLKGLSQRELAKRAGVTNSTISMIEKNSVSPSISSLRKVLGGIPMSMVEFFSEELEPENPTQVVYKASELIDISDGAVTMKLVGKSHPRPRDRVSLPRCIRLVPTRVMKCWSTKARRQAFWSKVAWSLWSGSILMCLRLATATISKAPDRIASAIRSTSRRVSSALPRQRISEERAPVQPEPSGRTQDEPEAIGRRANTPADFRDVTTNGLPAILSSPAAYRDRRGVIATMRVKA
jgi:transcriptional regulator with XRE-family HTH domain